MLLKKKKKPPKEKTTVKIQVEENKTTKIVGVYNKVTKEFKCTLEPEAKCFELDLGVLNFLIGENAIIIVRDPSRGWTYKSESSKVKVYGKLVEKKGARPLYALDINKWEVVKARDRTCVVKCEEITCRYNFACNCLKGAITINKEGRCNCYEEDGQ